MKRYGQSMLHYQPYLLKMKTMWHYGLFCCMAMMCCYVILFYVLNFTNIGFNNAGLALMLGMAAAAWFNTGAALCAFVAIIPLINGFSVTVMPVPAMIYNFIFSGIYIVWLVKYCLVQKKNVCPHTPAGLLIDILSTAIICSFLVQLLNCPFDAAFLNIWSPTSFDPRSSFYSIHAAVIILQGLFLYRMLELSMTEHDAGWPLLKALFFFTAVLLFFSVVQGIFNVPSWDRYHYLERHGLFSPFADIHSYGSVLVLVLPVFFYALWAADRRYKIICGTVAALLIICALLTKSRTTLFAMIALGMFLLLQSKYKRKALLAGLALIVLAAGALYGAAMLYPDKTSETKNSIYSTLHYRFIRGMNTADIIRARPLSGTGIGSYYRLYPVYGQLLADSGQSSPDPAVEVVRHHVENAHNYYLQFAADLGLPALAIFLFIIYCAFQEAFEKKKTAGHDPLLLTGLMAGLGAYLITCVPAHPLLLSNQQFIFWFAAGVLSLPISGSSERRFGLAGRIFIATLCVLIVYGYGRAFVTYKKSPGYEYGLYALDQVNQSAARWTQQKAGIRLSAASDIIALKYTAFPYNIGKEGLKVKIQIDDTIVDTRTIFEAGDYQAYYYVPGAVNNGVSLFTEVSKTFKPVLNGLSEDSRDLGIAVAPVSFLQKLPPDGIGFYPWEEWPINGKPVKVRWTRKQATMAVGEETAARGLRLGFISYHPDITANPIEVTILGNGTLLKKYTLAERAWKFTELSSKDIKNEHFLTFRVSRTWNPKAAGVSADARDLGVAVSIDNMP